MNHTYHVIDGLRYHVAEWGSGEPLLLLHGFTGSAAGWQPHAACFGKQFRVIAVDLPGHGLSDAPQDVGRYRPGRVAVELGLLLGALGAAPAHWLGYSMGGRLALFAAAHDPALVRSLVLESASPGLETAVERESRRAQDEALARRIESDGIPAFVDYWERLSLFATQTRLAPDLLAGQREQRLGNSARGLANSLRGMGTGAQPSLWPCLGRLNIPALLLVGELDEKFAAIGRRMTARWPSAELTVVPDAGHAVHLEQPQRFDEQVLNFLRRVSGERSDELAEGEQDHKAQRRQRHLFEPGVECC